MFEVTKISDMAEGVLRKASFLTCGAVCSTQIDIETEGDGIRRVQFFNGCNGNTQGVAALCAGMKVDDAVALSGRHRLQGPGYQLPRPACPRLEAID